MADSTSLSSGSSQLNSCQKSANQSTKTTIKQNQRTDDSINAKLEQM